MATLERLNEILLPYKPKEGYKVMKCITSETKRFYAGVFKDVPVNRFKRENAETSIGSIVTADEEEYMKFLQPYIQLK